MKFLLLTLLACYSLNIYAQSDDFIVIGTKEKIESKILGEERHLWIHTPPNMDSEKIYPVVYLLDGGAHFESVTALVDYMAGNGLCPHMIVVGILNTDRTRDLTPTKGEPNHPYISDVMLENSGGGDNFMKFMEEELFTLIETNYPTAPYRMFIGHSLGGLTTMNAIVHYTDLFNSYVSIDPSMWWSSQSLLNEIKGDLSKDKFAGKTLYLGIANTMDNGTTIEMAKADTSFESEHIRSIIATDEFFKDHPENSLEYYSKYYPNDSHGSVPMITEYDAFRAIFDYYKLDFEAVDPTDENNDLLQMSIAHFQQVSGEMGYEVLPDEWFINGLGYQFMGEEKFEQAESAFKYNVKNYPKSGNVYDSMGDYYNAVGDSKNAIQSYQSALDIEEAPHSRKKMEALQKAK